MREYSLHALSKEHLDKYWGQVKEYLHSGLLMCEGELNVDQLRLLSVQGLITIIVIVSLETNNVVGALALETVNYPNYKAANIVSYGGHNLFASEEDFNGLKQELAKAGVSQLQGWCKPAQARLFKHKYGFNTPYEMIRVSLTEEN